MSKPDGASVLTRHFTGPAAPLCATRRGVVVALALVLPLGLAPRAEAQDTGAPAGAAAGPPPPARVGQLSQTSGHARMRIDKASAWEPALLNTPITTGAALATQGSTAEVRIGSTALHLSVEAQVEWTELDDNTLHVEVVSGMVGLRIRALAAGERVLLSAGGVKVQVLKPGAYRLRHLAPNTRLAVWVQEGQARVATSPQESVLGPNQHVVVERRTAALVSSGASDETRNFDGIVEKRDRNSETSFSLLHIPAEMTGAEALDGRGQWRTEAGHGAVWFPDKLPPDWAPYRYGRWRWLAPWGWTWIDNAAWGFAPFHYGRWLFLAGRWAWVPGVSAAAPGAAASSTAVRPVFAPALVGFYGSPASAVWALPGTGAPTVGWYPLAPGEVYWPHYTTQASYVRALNTGSVVELDQIQAPPAANSAAPSHRYARAAFAASAMPYAAFNGQLEVEGQQMELSPAVLAQAPLSGRRWPPPKPTPGRPASTPP